MAKAKVPARRSGVRRAHPDEPVTKTTVYRGMAVDMALYAKMTGINIEDAWRDVCGEVVAEAVDRANAAHRAARKG